MMTTEWEIGSEQEVVWTSRGTRSQGRIHVQVSMVTIRMVGGKSLVMEMVMIMMILMSHWQAV